MKSFGSLIETLSLRHHPELNPAIWDGETLRPEVRTSLLRFADAFREFCKIPIPLVQDVLFVGGNASYFYNSESDLDVHLLVERKQLGVSPLVDDFLQDRKTLWSLKHHATIHGYPLEGYVQDPSEKAPIGQGVFSLQNNLWITHPIRIDYDPSTDIALERKVNHWKRVIEKAIKDRRDLTEFDNLKKKLSNLRTVGLQRQGEIAPENLIFKALRADGYLDRVNKYLQDTVDQSLSL
jgi:hypothetical protein